MFSKPKGTQDILKNALVFRFIENQFIKIVTNFNYQEIRTPMFEEAKLFSSLGEQCDVVQKELYHFTDKAKRQLALRPEGTAPIVRSYIENKMYVPNATSKFFYIGSMFRYERPQKGRKREFRQLGVEQIGAINTLNVVDVIILADMFLKSLLLDDYQVIINNLGSFAERKAYIQDLKKYFVSKLDTLCHNCKNRFEKNPLRLLDCKVDHIAPDTPKIESYINEKSKQEYSKAKVILKAQKVNIVEDQNLVRGLDYYSDIVFEIVPKGNTKSQSTILAGGQYNGLSKKLKGPDVSGVGFAAGVERLVNLLIENNFKLPQDKVKVFVCSTDSPSKVMEIVSKLREANIKSDFDLTSLDIKKQYKKATKLKVDWVIHIKNNKTMLKSQKSKIQMEDNIDQLIKKIKEDK